MCGTSLANLHEPINTVTHDTIHAHVEEGVHGRLVIDCPRVHLTPSPVCGGHETGRKDREPPKANGDLEGRIRRLQGTPRPSCEKRLP